MILLHPVAVVKEAFQLQVAEMLHLVVRLLVREVLDRS